MSAQIGYIPGHFAQQFGVDTLHGLTTRAGSKAKWTHFSLDQVEADLHAGGTSIGRCDAVVMGYQHVAQHGLPYIVRLRKALDCFANLRPIQTVPGLPSRLLDVDILVVRESTEDIYAQLEHESIPGVFESLKVTTRAACERIARFAFETALAKNRKKVTIVHKANIMKKSDGMFLTVARTVAEDYPSIEVDDCIVDALCMKLVLHPEWFDVLLCGNLFGDIVSDLGAGLVGGRRNCPSVNIGPNTAVFTTGQVSSDALDISLLRSTILMLAHIGEQNAASRLQQALQVALKEGLGDAEQFIQRLNAAL